MARAPRTIAESGYYHVTARGNGKQAIFEDEEDRYSFLNLFRKVMKADGVGIIAWCLMDNHVHLILHDERFRLSHAMQVLLSQYARYFNRKAGHVGHVFQERYSASPIEDDAYLIAAIRYLHANPAKAGIGSIDGYRWSSYEEYAVPGASTFDIADTSLVLDMLGGPMGFTQLFRETLDSRGLRTFEVKDSELSPIERTKRLAEPVLRKRNLTSPGEVKGLPRAMRDQVVRELHGAGISIRQIELLTGIGRGSIARAVKQRSM